MKLGPLFDGAGRRRRSRSNRPVPGDIVAVAKMEDLHTGTHARRARRCRRSRSPRRWSAWPSAPKSRGDEAKLSGSLHKIVEEDSTFKLDRDAQTKELVMTGMSELHLQIIQRAAEAPRQARSRPRRSRRSPTARRSRRRPKACYRHKKQSGGRGQFGEVHIRMFPFPRGTEPGGVLHQGPLPVDARTSSYDDRPQLPLGQLGRRRHDPQQLPAGGRKGLQGADGARRDRRLHGAGRGASRSTSASTTTSTSSEAAFKTAGSMAFRNVFQEAKPCLLEPIVKMEITVPGDKRGRHLQRHVQPRRPRAGHRLGRRRHA